MSLSDKDQSGKDQSVRLSDMVQSGRNLWLQGQSGMVLYDMLVLSGKDLSCMYLFDMDQFHMSLSCMGLRE